LWFISVKNTQQTHYDAVAGQNFACITVSRLLYGAKENAAAKVRAGCADGAGARVRDLIYGGKLEQLFLGPGPR
jgi:hypothetical protein